MFKSINEKILFPILIDKVNNILLDLPDFEPIPGPLKTCSEKFMKKYGCNIDSSEFIETNGLNNFTAEDLIYELINSMKNIKNENIIEISKSGKKNVINLVIFLANKQRFLPSFERKLDIASLLSEIYNIFDFFTLDQSDKSKMASYLERTFVRHVLTFGNKIEFFRKNRIE